MDYLTWVKIIAMAVRLMQEPAFEKDFRVHASWSSVDKLFLGSKLNNSVLNIDIYLSGSEEKVKSYVFIPWEDYYDKLTEIDDMYIPAMLNGIYTVTPYAIIYVVGGNPIAAQGKEDILGIFESRFGDLIGFEYCNAVAAKNDGITLPGQLQVISISERRYFVDINAAVPGSKPVDPGKLRETFPGKMIYLEMTPDLGAVRKQWIKGSEPDFIPYFDNTKHELERTLPDTVKKYETEFSIAADEKKSSKNKDQSVSINKITKQDSKKAQKNEKKDKTEAGIESDRKTDDMVEITPEDITFPTDEPFSDYIPKETPDDVLDYMPDLSDEIARKPAGIPGSGLTEI